MSLSNEWFEYHLTESRGWVEGSSKIDFAGLKERPIPSDRILTIRQIEEISSVYSRPYRETKITWTCDDEELINELKKKYGEAPKL